MKCSNCGHLNKQRKVELLPSDEFSKFWQSYPRKVGKWAAEKIWKRLKGDETLITIIMESLEKQKRSDPWQRDGGIYIPHPSTWLNQRRWEDNMPSEAPIVAPGSNLGPSKEELMQQANERAQAMMEIEYAKRQAMKNAAIRDDLRTEKMNEAWDHN